MHRLRNMTQRVREARGTTLIELMITVAVVAILVVSTALVRPATPVTRVVDRARALSVLRAAVAHVKALPAAELAALDGRPFPTVPRDMALLPNAIGTVRVAPIATPGLARVTLELVWHDDRMAYPEEERLVLATVGRVPLPPALPGGAP